MYTYTLYLYWTTSSLCELHYNSERHSRSCCVKFGSPDMSGTPEGISVALKLSSDE